MKSYNKNKESSCIQYLDENNLNGWIISQKLPVDGFKWKKNMLKFNEDFKKYMMKTVIKDTFLK